MSPMCDRDFSPSTGTLLPRVLAERESGMEGIGSLRDEAPEDLPRGDHKAVIPGVIFADVYQPDETAFPATRNLKCGSKQFTVEVFVVLLAGDLLLVLPVRQRLDEPRFQMRTTWSTPKRADCVVCWHNSLLLQIVAHPIVPRLLNIVSVIPTS
jgi:hypothetical protein